MPGNTCNAGCTKCCAISNVCITTCVTVLGTVFMSWYPALRTVNRCLCCFCTKGHKNWSRGQLYHLRVSGFAYAYMSDTIDPFKVLSCYPEVAMPMKPSETNDHVRAVWANEPVFLSGNDRHAVQRKIMLTYWQRSGTTKEMPVEFNDACTELQMGVASQLAKAGFTFGVDNPDKSDAGSYSGPPKTIEDVAWIKKLKGSQKIAISGAWGATDSRACT